MRANISKPEKPELIDESAFIQVGNEFLEPIGNCTDGDAFFERKFLIAFLEFYPRDRVLVINGFPGKIGKFLVKRGKEFDLVGDPSGFGKSKRKFFNRH